MGKLTDDMTRLVDEIGTMAEVRGRFIKGIQDVVKEGADNTRKLIIDFKSDINGAHDAFFGTKNSFGGKPSRKKKTVHEM